MIYEECMNLVEAYANACVLVEKLDGPLLQRATNTRDYLGEFIGSLLEESPIGDRHKRQSDE